MIASSDTCASTTLLYFERLYKDLGYFLVTSVAFILCAWHVKFNECLQFEQSVIEMLPSFV